jgi:hypothetical protein
MNIPVTIEQVAHQFQIWRSSKISKFDPIPTHLKDLISQLLDHYSQQTIISQLKISSTTISSIKKSHSLHRTKSNSKPHTKPRTKSHNKVPQTGTRHANSTNSKIMIDPSNMTLSEAQMSFIPFQLKATAFTPADDSAADSTISWPSSAQSSLSQSSSSVAQSSSSSAQSFSASSSPSVAQSSNCATCHITRTDGSSLIIKTSDLKSVIQAFLCSS